MQAEVPQVNGVIQRRTRIRMKIMIEKNQQHPPRKRSTRCRVDSFWML